MNKPFPISPPPPPRYVPDVPPLPDVSRDRGRDLVPSLSDGRPWNFETPDYDMQPGAGGSAPVTVAAVALPLTLTTVSPVGWVAPESETPGSRVRVWLVAGTFDGLFPAIDSTPSLTGGTAAHSDIGSNGIFLTPLLDSDASAFPIGTRYCRAYLKAEWTGPASNTSSAFNWTVVSAHATPLASSSNTRPTDAPYNTVGSPGAAGVGWQDYYMIPLALIAFTKSVEGGSVTVSFADNAGGSLRVGLENVQSTLTAIIGDPPEIPHQVVSRNSLIIYRIPWTSSSL